MEGQDGLAAIGHVRYATCGGGGPELRATVRARARPQDQVVRVRVQRAARQLPGPQARAARAGRLPPEARHRHRDPDALAELRAPGREARSTDWCGVFAPPVRSVRRRLQRRAPHGRRATWSWPATRWGSARSASPSTARCSPPPARASRSPTSVSRTSARSNRGRSSIANRKGVRIERFAASPRRAHCFFEWIYFANVASTLDDRSVYLSRSRAGQGAGAAGRRAARRRDDRRARARHRQGRRRRHGLRPGVCRRSRA